MMNCFSTLHNNRGFTLLEAMIALFVLVVGIFALYSMQITAINGNSRAFRVTTASNWAADKIEEIIKLPYDELKDNTRSTEDYNGTDQDTDAGGDGIDDDGDDFGLNDTVAADGSVVSDGDATSPDGKYRIFWNVAVDHPMAKLKMLRIIVRYDYLGVSKSVAMDYVKPQM